MKPTEVCKRCKGVGEVYRWPNGRNRIREVDVCPDCKPTEGNPVTDAEERADINAGIADLKAGRVVTVKLPKPTEGKP